MRETEAKLPQWWSHHIQESWNRSRDAALGDWSVHGDRSMPIDAAITEAALAFGHGARAAYPHLTSWDMVCPELRIDWVRLGHVGPAAWSRVVDVVRHEWLRAAGPDGDAAPEPDQHRSARERHG
ncbi:MAG TPA: hypothetical protein VLB44_10735 [Kofleriaceae bacterium]|nr:hypothetical protein [Kofleriaceae bacterium]